MKDNNKFSGKSIYNIFMTVFYLFVAWLFVFSTLFNSLIEIYWIRIAIAVLLCLNSFFRGYKVWREISDR